MVIRFFVIASLITSISQNKLNDKYKMQISPKRKTGTLLSAFSSITKAAGQGEKGRKKEKKKTPNTKRDIDRKIYYDEEYANISAISDKNQPRPPISLQQDGKNSRHF